METGGPGVVRGSREKSACTCEVPDRGIGIGVGFVAIEPGGHIEHLPDRRIGES